ncbi:MAG: hypothetical protein ABSG15_04365 [FCB group bacterium]|jgi:hypothetical protein
MNENEHTHNLLEMQEKEEAKHDHKPYWKRVHHSWIFWIFLVLTLLAILYYTMTDDFSFAPRSRAKQPLENISP